MVVLAEGSKLLFVPEAGHFPVHTAPLAQCAWGTSSQSEVADEAGDGGGEVFNPSTWMKAAQSTGEAGDAALRIFLDLVIMGKMTGLLLVGVSWAVAVSTIAGSIATATEAVPVFTSSGGACCCCCCWESCCCCC